MSNILFVFEGMEFQETLLLRFTDLLELTVLILNAYTVAKIVKTTKQETVFDRFLFLGFQMLT